MGSPARPELVTAGGELTDKVSEVAIEGVASGFCAQRGDGLVGDLVPVVPERLGSPIQEEETGVVDPLALAFVQRLVQGSPQGVGCQDVAAGTQDERRGGGHGVQDQLDGRTHPQLRGRSALGERGVGGLRGLGDARARRRRGERHGRYRRGRRRKCLRRFRARCGCNHFLAPKAGDSASACVDREPDVSGGEPRTPGLEEAPNALRLSPVGSRSLTRGA